MLMTDPFGRTQVLPDHDQRRRVELLKEAAAMLIATGTPAGLFTGGAIEAWLRDGKPRDLTYKYLRVTPRRGSHATAQQLAALMDQERKP